MRRNFSAWITRVTFIVEAALLLLNIAAVREVAHAVEISEIHHPEGASLIEPMSLYLGMQSFAIPTGLILLILITVFALRGLVSQARNLTRLLFVIALFDTLWLVISMASQSFHFLLGSSSGQ